MIRGLYTAASGMITQQRRHDTVTQNIANINTMGYKQVDSVARSFPEVLISVTGGDSNNKNRQLGKLNTGVFMEESLSMFVQGDITETNKSTDFALQSDLTVNDPATRQPIPFDANGKYVDEDGNTIYQPQSFFTVQDDQGQVRYTRDGNFKVNANGELLTSTGFQVLGANNQPLTIAGSIDNLKVDGQGRIIDMTTGMPTGASLSISVVSQPYEMVREGNGVFRIDNEDAAGVRLSAMGDNIDVRQGYVERSNVNSTQAMVDMNLAARAYESNQKVIQYYDRSLDKAVNEIGRV
ncbi:flagellar hook-basal body protein [Paenibacillus glacialis]|uniref:Flagellar basal body rod protein n=1 Tax=Paenibacillus glacialis TaxID=494026 RepID=A0A168L5J2_9BACL|nr:flagellar hook-basal body protein [Paenibacillus glacialis]OAB42909.1 flagellar basal body rod protein [Paenibacillus glacialis]